MSTTKIFSDRFAAGVDQLKQELNNYASESDIWETYGLISNSAGNLTLHLIGNLNHFIGAQLGATGYVRNREKEFADKNIPLAEMLAALDAASAMVQATFSNLNEEDLLKPYPLDTFGPGKNILAVLVILIGHFNYHLGQINFHRRGM